MARRLRDHPGGRRSLRELITQHKEAVEYDLITLGLRLDWLGTPALSWRDLLVVVKQSPRTSAISRAVLGEAAEWGLAEQLGATQVDALNTLAWLQSADGAKNRNRPQPIRRPGVKPTDEITHGSASMPLDEMAQWLNRRNPNQPMT